MYFEQGTVVMCLRSNTLKAAAGEWGMPNEELRCWGQPQLHNKTMTPKFKKEGDK